MIFERKFDANLEDNNRKTALIYASINNDSFAVKLLIEKGVDINYRSTEKKSAYDWAKTYDNCSIMNLLKDAGYVE